MADALEGFLAEVVLCLVLDQPFHPHDVERGVGEGDVRPVVEDAGLDPPRLTGSDGSNLELLAGGMNRVPELGAAAARSSRLTSKPGTAVQPVRLITTGISPIVNSPSQ